MPFDPINIKILRLPSALPNFMFRLCRLSVLKRDWIIPYYLAAHERARRASGCTAVFSFLIFFMTLSALYAAHTDEESENIPARGQEFMESITSGRCDFGMPRKTMCKLYS